MEGVTGCQQGPVFLRSIPSMTNASFVSIGLGTSAYVCNGVSSYILSSMGDVLIFLIFVGAKLGQSILLGDSSGLCMIQSGRFI